MIWGARKVWKLAAIYFPHVQTNLRELSSEISVFLFQNTLCVRWKNITFCALNCGCMSLQESFSKLRSCESFVPPGGNFLGGNYPWGNCPGGNVRVGFFGGEILGRTCPGGTVRGGKLSGGELCGGNCPGENLLRSTSHRECGCAIGDWSSFPTGLKD